MDLINFPLLYFQLREDFVLGILVGTNHQMVDKGIGPLRTGMHRYLQRQYKKYNEYPDMNIIEPKLKVVEVSLRPTYRTSQGAYPMSQEVTLPIAAVYGETDLGHHQCYLPLLQQNFHYYEEDQFLPLLQNLAGNALNQYSPERLYQIIQYPPPQLEMITLKVNYDRDLDYDWGFYQRKHEFLERLTEPFPYSKAQKKQLSNLPDAAWEMEQPVDDIVEKILHQRANVLVVGLPGIGKSAVLSQALKKIHLYSKKEQLDYTFWRIMAQRITASAKYLGEWEETVEGLIEDLKSVNGILWVDEIIRLLESGGEGPEDSVAAFLLSFIQRGDLQLVGELTPTQLESMRRMLPGFVESFQLVELKELPEKKIQIVLEKAADYIGRQMKLKIPVDSIQLIYRLLKRYYPYEQFPGKGIKFLGHCANETKLSELDTISPKIVIQNFIKQTGLPELFLRDDLLLDQEELKQHFQRQIIGQEGAIDHLCGIVKIYKAGLNNPHKPITTLLFAGPTGVGKTASAKALAQYFFGKGQQKSPLVRIDMSEFQFPGQLNRLIGAGREVGQLVKEIRERPFSVLLLDEVEKADPSIFDALLTVLDEGMLVDHYGRVTNFRNTIIIMTTNLGASNRQSIGFQETTDPFRQYESAIARFFRPEFFNRIDRVVVFGSLKKEHIRKIAQLELQNLQAREGLQQRNLQLEFYPSLVERLIQDGFNEKYGARPLQRTLERIVAQPLARWLLAHPKVKNTTIGLGMDQQDALSVDPKSRVQP
jgi:ATP-dependent Clp protease ATP-binding subunit ClpC